MLAIAVLPSDHDATAPSGDIAVGHPPPVPPAEADRLARAALSRVCEPDDAELHALLATSRAADVWEALRTGADGLPEALAARAAGRLDAVRPERDLDRITSLGGHLVCPGDPDWPDGVDDLTHPPYALWVRGPADLREITARSIAIVGARAATAYGVHVAGELAASLADLGWTVVSGGAYGVDGAAHRGALSVGGTTVASLACGLDVSYPSGHSALFARIAEEGLLLSEWPPGCSPMRHRFLVRNRVIAALTRGTVVAEAAVRSGARRTAGDAAALGRAVMAIPGPVTSAMSAGCHSLIRDGATCVTAAVEVIEAVGPIGSAPADAGGAGGPGGAGEADGGRDGLGPLAQRVLDATPRTRPAPVERIAATAGLAVLDVARQLARLEVLGHVLARDGRFRLAPDRPAES